MYKTANLFGVLPNQIDIFTKVFFKITVTDFLHRCNFFNFYSIFFFALQFVEIAEHSIIISKGIWRKMKKKIFNFFPRLFETIKSIPLRSPIFRKLKYVPISIFLPQISTAGGFFCTWFHFSLILCQFKKRRLCLNI